MRIPEVREEIDRLIDEAEELHDTLGKMIKRLNYLQSELVRRPAKRRAPTTSTPFNAAMKARIVAYAAANPSASQTSIAAQFNVNPGRVSEALFGKRT